MRRKTRAAVWKITWEDAVLYPAMLLAAVGLAWASPDIQYLGPIPQGVILAAGFVSILPLRAMTMRGLPFGTRAAMAMPLLAALTIYGGASVVATVLCMMLLGIAAGIVPRYLDFLFVPFLVAAFFVPVPFGAVAGRFFGKFARSCHLQVWTFWGVLLTSVSTILGFLAVIRFMFLASD
jgi:hypothetical protein